MTTPTKHPNQRVAVFVDVQNIYYSAKNVIQAKVDFGKVLKESVGDRPLIRAFAYVIKADVGMEKEFFEALYHRGFEVKEKDLQIFYGGAKKGDWDVGLCMDVVRMLNRIDVAIIVSGDGDYAELLEYSRSQGVRTEVVAFGKTASSHLLQKADEFLDIGANPGKFIVTSRPKRSSRSKTASAKNNRRNNAKNQKAPQKNNQES